MKRFFTSLLLCLLLSQTLSAQTRTDSICGTYTRHTWQGVGNMHLDYGNGTYAEVTGYTISTTDESLLLDKNHCAALTVYSEPGNYSLMLFNSNPVVYYGIWRMSGDTAVITYTKSAAESLFFIYGSSEPFGGISTMSQPMQRKYLIENNERLTSLEPGDNANYLFYKEEELIK